jgi:hypothetical protein
LASVLPSLSLSLSSARLSARLPRSENAAKSPYQLAVSSFRYKVTIVQRWWRRTRAALHAWLTVNTRQWSQQEALAHAAERTVPATLKAAILLEDFHERRRALIALLDKQTRAVARVANTRASNAFHSMRLARLETHGQLHEPSAAHAAADPPSGELAQLESVGRRRLRKPSSLQSLRNVDTISARISAGAHSAAEWARCATAVQRLLRGHLIRRTLNFRLVEPPPLPPRPQWHALTPADRLQRLMSRARLRMRQQESGASNEIEMARSHTRALKMLQERTVPEEYASPKPAAMRRQRQPSAAGAVVGRRTSPSMRMMMAASARPGGGGGLSPTPSYS